MPTPKGSKAQRCAMQRALFSKDPKYAKEWVREYGDQCEGISMKATRRVAKDGRKAKKK